MAIYIGVKLVREADGLKVFEFHQSDGTSYGLLEVDPTTVKFRLLENRHERCLGFAYPRACRAIELAARRGAIPDELCWAA